MLLYTVDAVAVADADAVVGADVDAVDRMLAQLTVHVSVTDSECGEPC